VEAGVESTAKAGDALKETIQMSEQVGEMITHIATAAAEQSSASEEVNHNMDQIARLVKESAERAQQSAKASQDLSGLALDLQNMVAHFKLAEDSAFSKRRRPGIGESGEAFLAQDRAPARAFGASAG
jgi:methyl-accepting chemotaxis protein